MDRSHDRNEGGTTPTKQGHHQWRRCQQSDSSTANKALTRAASPPLLTIPMHSGVPSLSWASLVHGFSFSAGFDNCSDSRAPFYTFFPEKSTEGTEPVFNNRSLKGSRNDHNTLTHVLCHLLNIFYYIPRENSKRINWFAKTNPQNNIWTHCIPRERKERNLGKLGSKTVKVLSINCSIDFIKETGSGWQVQSWQLSISSGDAWLRKYE